MSDIISKKHSVTTEFNLETGLIHSLQWTNSIGQSDAPGDLPAELEFENGVLRIAAWLRNGVPHRGGDLPALIFFDDLGRPRSWVWKRDGVRHRDGDMPADITFKDGSLQDLKWVEFYKHGEPFRAGGKAAAIHVQEDGSITNEAGHPVDFEGFDSAWLPSPVPTLLIPQLELLKLTI